MTELIISVINRGDGYDGVYFVKTPESENRARKIIEDTKEILENVNEDWTQEQILSSFKTVTVDYLPKLKYLPKIEDTEDVLDFICSTRANWSFKKLDVDVFNYDRTTFGVYCE